MNNFKNVVMFSLDCVRREALDCYPQSFPWRTKVFSKAATPAIGRICSEGVRFDQAITHAPFTPASHASLFTGLNPPKHGVRRLLGTKLNEDINTLAELLSAAGWQCRAVVSAYSMSEEYGFGRGFEHYSGMSEGDRDNRVLRGAEEVTDQALRWLDDFKQDEPFFLFVHYFDAHNVPSSALIPQTSSLGSTNVTKTKRFRHTIRDTLPGPIRSIVRQLDENVRGLYFKGVGITQSISDWVLAIFEAGRDYQHEGRRFMLQRTAEIDTQIERIIQSLAEKNKLDDTLIILMADHGDDFWEHGEPTHRQFLYDTTLLVPLIIYPLIGNRSQVADQVRLVDILPTIMDLLGVVFTEEIDGESLLPLLDENDRQDLVANPRKAYSETLFDVKSNEASNSEIITCLASLREYPWKLIWNRLSSDYEIYQVDKDPGESKNLIEKHPDVVERLAAELRNLAQEMPVENEQVDELMVERLKALGYL